MSRRALVAAGGSAAVAAAMLVLPLGATEDKPQWQAEAVQLATTLVASRQDGQAAASELSDDLAELGYRPVAGSVQQPPPDDDEDAIEDDDAGGGAADDEQTGGDEGAAGAEDDPDEAPERTMAPAPSTGDDEPGGSPDRDATEDDAAEDEEQDAESSAPRTTTPRTTTPRTTTPRTSTPAADEEWERGAAELAELVAGVDDPAARELAEILAEAGFDGDTGAEVEPSRPSTTPRSPDSGSGGGGDMPAITVEGDQILRGGEPWWFLGYNSFVWSANCGNDDEKMSEADVEEWFSSMRDDGHGAVRLFFYDGWDIDRLDHAVETARANNVYVTITLDDAIGGCGENDKTAEWFADQSERDTFQSHMEMLLERYKGNTTFAWFEFFNEPDYEDGALVEFYDEMGAVADTIDPDRLFSSGTVAPYWVDGEDNFAEIQGSPGVDISSMHEYDEGEVESNHGDGVRANSAGKPVIVGEFGINAGEGCDVSLSERAERFEAKAEAYTDIGAGYVGALAWAWQPGESGGCDLGNLDEDGAVQEVMRTFGGSEGGVAEPVTVDADSDGGDTDAVEDDEPADDEDTGDEATADEDGGEGE